VGSPTLFDGSGIGPDVMRSPRVFILAARANSKAATISGIARHPAVRDDRATSHILVERAWARWIDYCRFGPLVKCLPL
jgi:hypothetical protein